MRHTALAFAAVLVAAQGATAQGRPDAAGRAAEGLRALESGRWDAAEAAFLEARRLDPGATSYTLGLAQARLSAGKFLEAIPLLQEAAMKLPDDAAVRFALAQAYLGAGKDADAARSLGGKTPTGPLAAPWLFHRGFALYRLNDYASAAPLFQRLLAYPDMRAPAEFFIANCHAARGDLEASLPHYERAIQAGARPDNRALNAYHYNYGLALFRLGRHQEAAGRFTESARLFPQDPMPYYLLGRSLAELQRFPEAIQAIEIAVRLAPDFSAGYYQLALLHRRHGDKDRARALFERVERLKSAELEHSMESALRMRSAPPPTDRQ